MRLFGIVRLSWRHQLKRSAYLHLKIWTAVLLVILVIFLNFPERARSAPANDFYKTLEVSREATDKEITKSYRKLSMKYHPDRNPGNPEAEAKFKELSEAYSVLHDGEKQKNYDLYHAQEGETRLDYLERKHAEQGLTYFEASEYADLKWRTREKGTSYEAAKVAFANNSYYAAKEVGNYILTQDELFEFAAITAKEKGAVFTELIPLFHIADPLRRFQLGLIAAQKNSWSNVKFNLHSFMLDEYPQLKFGLARAALKRSDYQMQYMGEYGFSRKQLLTLLTLNALQGPRVVENLDLIPLSQNERFQVFLKAASRDLKYSLINFELFKLTDPVLVAQAAEKLAAAHSDFGAHLKYLGLTDKDQISHLAELTFKVKYSDGPKNSGPEGFSLSDRELLKLYFRHLLRQEPWRNPLKDLFLSRGGRYPPRMARSEGERNVAGYARSASLMGPLFKGDNSVLSEPADSVYRDYLKKIAVLSVGHPELLPPAWINLVSRFAGLAPDVSLELLRLAYRLSAEDHFFTPSEPFELLRRGTGLDFASFKEDNAPSTVLALYRSLLALNEYLGAPAYDGIQFSPEVFETKNIPKFIALTDALTAELVKRTRGWERDEVDKWPQLVNRFDLKKQAITSEKMTRVIDLLTRPHEGIQDCTALMVL